MDEVIAKNVAEHLHKHYPGHLWAVNVEGGVVNVHNLFLSGTWGFRIFISDIDVDYKVVTRAGGELLERYNVARKAMNPDEIAALKRNLRGEVIHDAS